MKNIEQKDNDTSNSNPFIIDVGFASRGFVNPATLPCFLISKSKVGKRTVKVFKKL